MASLIAQDLAPLFLASADILLSPHMPTQTAPLSLVLLQKYLNICLSKGDHCR